MNPLLLIILAAAAQAAPHEKIIGGQDANVLDFPYQVSMQLQVLWSGKAHICGGTIIDKRWILTAGHCLTNLPFPDWLPHSFVIRAGITSLSEEGGQEIKVAQTIVHDNFNSGVGSDDIALLYLESDLQFNDKVQQALLPIEFPYLEADAVVSGWGTVKNALKPVPSDHLKKATVNILSHQECKDALVNLTGVVGPLTENNICTGPLTGGLGACSGDSGGPLAQNGYVIGVVSWGLNPCAMPGAPAVFTKVNSYLAFIAENVILG